jgi:preprotein translocase subunit SecG
MDMLSQTTMLLMLIAYIAGLITVVILLPRSSGDWAERRKQGDDWAEAQSGFRGAVLAIKRERWRSSLTPL